MMLHLVTSNLIEEGGKFLLVQEGHEFASGLWNFPAGKVEEEITLSENAAKEAEEETGCKVKIKGLVGIYQEIHEGRNVVLFVFASSIAGGKLRSHSDGEILQAKWFTLGEIIGMKNKLRSGYVLNAINDYRKRGLLDLDLMDSKDYRKGSK